MTMNQHPILGDIALLRFKATTLGKRNDGLQKFGFIRRVNEG